MKKICAVSGKEFEITQEDLEFYKRMDVPIPTLCPEERARRRFAWRNERTLYWRKCDGSEKRILSIFSEDKPFTVYDTEYWYSDKWNPMDFGRDFDFSKPFFSQFRELMEAVPQLARSAGGHSENSEYSNQADYLKNCFWVFEAMSSESCYFCSQITNAKDCTECSPVQKSELLYECIDCVNCYESKFLQNCNNCSDSWFLKDCIGCNNCFGSMNLRNKKYYFLNQKYSKSEYAKKLKNLNLENYSNLKNMRQNAQKFFQKFPHKFITGSKNENSTGNYLKQTQNCKNCFDVSDAQDCKNIFYAFGGLKNVHDLTVYGSGGVEFCYENHEIGEDIQNICFSDQIWEGCSNIFYSKLCMHNSHDLFGCVGLQHKKYCIFNKQYTKDEYFELREKIIEHMKKTGEWGEFFPIEMSPFGYNETVAWEYFPLNKREAQEKWFNWSDYEAPFPKVDKIIPASKLPEDINKIPDDILKWAIKCEVSEKPFRIIAQELEFYRKYNLPIPKRHPDQRHLERMKLRNPRKLFDRKCDKCWIKMKTTFSPERPEIVYCEKCYEKEIY